MPEHTSTLRRARAWGLACLLGLAVTVTVAPLSANGSQGSVPAEVAAFAADPAGLRAELDDLFGIGSSGVGVDFNDSTEVGQLNRVFAFTGDFLAGVASETPVERRNEWTAPITVNDSAIGLATVWINPVSVEPELADFVRGSTVAIALANVSAEAFLVRDDPADAWFSLEEGKLTPLVSGSSGISGTTPLSVYQGILTGRDAAPVTPVRTDSGTLTSIIVIALAVFGVASILIVPRLVARRRDGMVPVEPPD
ncbi:MAG: hypothetical protein ABL886_06670 [Rhodoglobus sp.]